MMIRTAVLIAALALTAVPSAADPNPQLVASVQNGLKQYGISADVSQFATSTVVALHFSLSSSKEPYFKKRHQLRSILRNAKYK